MTKLGILLAVAIHTTSAYSEECREWFDDLHISPSDPDCEIKCATGGTDMGTFDCPPLCKKFCKQPKTPQTECEKLQSSQPESCKDMTAEEAQQLLLKADPKNFPKTQYKSPPDEGKSIEEQTDCSTFVHEIFQRQGFEYPMSVSWNLKCVSTFKPVEGEGKPGDIIVFPGQPGHVGIINQNGKVISATVGGRRHRAEENPKSEDFISSIQTYKKEVFKGKETVLRWTCSK